MPSSEQKIAQLQQLLDLRDLIDQQLERCLKDRSSLSQAMSTVLPALRQFFGADAVFLQSYNEELRLSLFTSPPNWSDEHRQSGSLITAALTQTGEALRSEFQSSQDGAVLLAKPLDVAGEWFGSIGLRLPASAALAQDLPQLSKLLDMAGEELDNYLAAVREARQKQRTLMALSDALRHQVLQEGFGAASEVLSRELPVQKLLVVYRADEEGAPLHIHLFEGGACILDTDKESMAEDRRHELLTAAMQYLEGNSRELLQTLELTGAQEEVLVNGVAQQVVIGRLLACSPRQEFNTHDRDLLASFAGLLRQRLVDFGKEWRQLAESFCARDVTQLLTANDYTKSFLTPHEAEVALVYADIAGFTRISEQVLRNPMAVSQLIEVWSREAVRIVWEHGGVFDKMVGDCIIAIFGPPFYRQAPGERLKVALRCAVAIRDMTRSFHLRPEIAQLGLPEIGVAVGVNLTSVMVGYFGANSNYTCFSSGMNNTARLQGCAVKHEILLIDEAIPRLPEGHGFSFGQERAAAVKNVAAPLRFRDVL